MNPIATQKITMLVVAMAAATSVASFFVASHALFVGALCGSVLSIANWLALRYTLSRIETASDSAQASLMMMLVLKMSALIAVVGLLIVKAKVDPVGLAFGLSTLVLGVLFGSAGAMNTLASSAEGGKH